MEAVSLTDLDTVRGLGPIGFEACGSTSWFPRVNSSGSLGGLLYFELGFGNEPEVKGVIDKETRHRCCCSRDRRIAQTCNSKRKNDPCAGYSIISWSFEHLRKGRDYRLQRRRMVLWLETSQETCWRYFCCWNDKLWLRRREGRLQHCHGRPPRIPLRSHRCTWKGKFRSGCEMY